MTKIVAMFTLLLLVSGCATWSKKDIAREAAWQTLNYVDWTQTRKIARHPENYSETNPILGKYPSLEEVNLYMGTSALLHPIIAHYIPTWMEATGVFPQTWVENSRAVFQYITIGINTGNVVHNYNIGLRISF